MTKLVLAEKPSVARDLAAFLGARSRRDGYLEGNSYQVTWALGHLVTLQEPHDIAPELKRWTLASLPILPEKFGLKVIGQPRAREQFARVAALIRSADELICATDAGREGELIFRYILERAGAGERPFQRLWLSSLTPAAIESAFAGLRPHTDFDALYAAARCRSESDWLVGLNATRCYTVRYGRGGLLWSIGRVQTPVLALVVQRDDEIRVFEPETYHKLITHYRDVELERRGERLFDRRQAEELLQRVTGQPLRIERIQTKDESVPPPLLYDLTALQRDMNTRSGMAASATLDIAQKLYESKLITYPRTDSRHLPAAMHGEVRRALEQLAALRPQEIGRLDLTALPLPGRVFDDKKVRDHHAILPTGNRPGGLGDAMQKVFDAIVLRLICAFYPSCEKSVTTVEAESAGVPFRARGVRVLEPGWTALLPKPKAKKKAGVDEQELPAFEVGESGPHQPELVQAETKPPRHFTDSTLLAAMETAGKLVDDDELKAALREKGLGTPATRAAIIETLLHRGYLRRDKKTLLATDLGRYLIALVPHADLKSPELTGEWEGQLSRIARGELEASAFMAGIRDYTRELVARSSGSAADRNSLGHCPRCGAAVIEGQRGYGCSAWNAGCGFVLWREYRGITLNLEQVRELIQRRILLRPVTLPEVGPRILYLTASGAVVDIAVPDKQQQPGRGAAPRPPRARGGAPGKHQATTRGKPPQSPSRPRGKAPTERTMCPQCGAPMAEYERSYGCTAWRQGCKFAIWKTIAGKKITRSMARRLVAKGHTQVLKGFRSKAGKTFDARLRLQNGNVELELE